MRANPACGPLAALFHLSGLHIEMQKYNNETGRQNNLAKLFLSRSLRHIDKLRATPPRKVVLIIQALLRRSLDLSRRSQALKIPSLALKNRSPEDYIRGFYARILYVFQPFRKMFQSFSGYLETADYQQGRG